MGDITGKNKKLKTEKGIMMGYAGSRPLYFVSSSFSR